MNPLHGVESQHSSLTSLLFTCESITWSWKLGALGGWAPRSPRDGNPLHGVESCLLSVLASLRPALSRIHYMELKGSLAYIDIVVAPLVRIQNPLHGVESGYLMILLPSYTCLLRIHYMELKGFPSRGSLLGGVFWNPLHGVERRWAQRGNRSSTRESITWSWKS